MSTYIPNADPKWCKIFMVCDSPVLVPPHLLQPPLCFFLSFTAECPTRELCLTVGHDSEPCMRGHRSSKCNHTDRILVKVRKPGRPLSSCPHTLSSSSPGTFVHSSPGAISNGGGTTTKMNTYGETHRGNGCNCEVTSVAIPKRTQDLALLLLLRRNTFGWFWIGF